MLGASQAVCGEAEVRVVILLVAMLLALPANKEVTIRIPLSPGPEPEEISVLTFDPERVSAKDLEKWILVHENARLVTPTVGYYPDCKTSDVPKLKEDIKKNEEILNEINRTEYPKGLGEVVQYVKDMQSAWLWVSRQELEYTANGKLPGNEYKDLELSGCRIRTDDEAKMCFRVSYEWHNCANNAAIQRYGNYPKEKWKAFLASVGVRERMESGLPE
jgi:hypothetical protein